MDHLSDPPASALTELAELADQWTVLREQFAFLGEALLRLIADHPDLSADVVQGAVENLEEVRRKAYTFSQTLKQLHH